MKRISSSDSLGALMSMCHKTEENSTRSNYMYNREYQSMVDGFDEEGCMEEYGHVAEKKRRLSVDQVKELERQFEVENKLEPERKGKLAQELGLQPRQVAVWFQNRRARWKTKQLERDYGVLKANFDSLQQNYESLKLDKQALLKEIKELKLKLKEENPDENMPNKDEETTEPSKFDSTTSVLEDVKKLKVNSDSVAFRCSELKADGQSDSDSSAILNDEQSPNASNSTSGMVQNQETFSLSFIFNSCSSSSHCLSFTNSNLDGFGGSQNNVYHPQFVKLEEHNFFGEGDEACNFFAEEQAPSLHWCSADQWA